jgi:hypothetical protein
MAPALEPAVTLEALSAPVSRRTTPDPQTTALPLPELPAQLRSNGVGPAPAGVTPDAPATVPTPRADPRR